MLIEPLVSVIVPAYNVEKYIEQCLLSILSQTYTNIELIVVNDGSFDNSEKIIKSLQKQYDFKFVNQINQGQSIARNRAIDESNGDYVFFVDADDYIELNTISELIDSAITNKADVVRFNADSFIDDDINGLIKIGNYNFGNKLNGNTLYVEDGLSDIYNSFSPTVYLYLVKKEILEKNKIKFKENIIHEDELFSLEVFLNAKRFTFVNEFFYHRRIHENSTMTSRDLNHLKYSLESYFIVLKELENIQLKNKDIFQKNIFLKNRIKIIYLSMSLSKLSRKEKKEYLKPIKSVSLTYKILVGVYIQVRKRIPNNMKKSILKIGKL